MQINLPTLDALDAEFGFEDKQCAPGRRRQEGASIDATKQSEFLARRGVIRPGIEAMTRSPPKTVRPSLSRRVSRALVRFLIIFSIGISATLAWQSYGDAGRAMVANSSPQLGWLAPAPLVQSAAIGTPSPELQQLAFGLAAMRQSMDQLVAQLAADQQQMAAEIAKLQGHEEEILRKLSAAPPRPAAAPARKPAPATMPSSPSVQEPVAALSSPSAQAR